MAGAPGLLGLHDAAWANLVKGPGQQPDKRPGLGCLPVPSAGPSSRLTNAELILSCGCQGLFGFVNAYLVSGKQASEGLGTSLTTAPACGKGASPFDQAIRRGLLTLPLLGQTTLPGLLVYDSLDKRLARLGNFKAIYFSSIPVFLPTLASERQIIFPSGEARSLQSDPSSQTLPLCTFLFEQVLLG